MTTLKVGRAASVGVRNPNLSGFTKTRLELTVCKCGQNLHAVYGELKGTTTIPALKKLLESAGKKNAVPFRTQGTILSLSRESLERALKALTE